MASSATYYVDRGALIITKSGSYNSAASSKDLSSDSYISYPFKYSNGKLLTYNSGMLFQGTYKYILIFG